MPKNCREFSFYIHSILFLNFSSKAALQAESCGCAVKYTGFHSGACDPDIGLLRVLHQDDTKEFFAAQNDYIVRFSLNISFFPVTRWFHQFQAS